jgi:hypothetical protein
MLRSSRVIVLMALAVVSGATWATSNRLHKRTTDMWIREGSVLKIMLVSLFFQSVVLAQTLRDETLIPPATCRRSRAVHCGYRNDKDRDASRSVTDRP